MNLIIIDDNKKLIDDLIQIKLVLFLIIIFIFLNI